MGFPSVCYTVILPRPVALVIHLLDRIKLAVSMALFHLGLTSSSSYEDQFLFPLQLPDFIPASPSFSLPLPASAIKIGVLRRDPVCAVCLGALEARHEVRQLGNCCHAFHRACIDKWVDIGHVTCPLCRAQLLPNRREEEEEEEDGVDAD
ncbi:hypothetical protein GW17_00032399 [Ensete ventricosum]|nr:hypothetical protein GW17_00032399 [Ensete ventricosum]